jgi:hypothetical protein
VRSGSSDLDDYNDYLKLTLPCSNDEAGLMATEGSIGEVAGGLDKDSRED